MSEESGASFFEGLDSAEQKLHSSEHASFLFQQHPNEWIPNDDAAAFAAPVWVVEIVGERRTCKNWCHSLTPLTCEKAFHISLVFSLQKKFTRFQNYINYLRTVFLTQHHNLTIFFMSCGWEVQKWKKSKHYFYMSFFSKFHPPITILNRFRHEHGLDSHYRSLEHFLYLSLTGLAEIFLCFTWRMFLCLSLSHLESSSNIISCLHWLLLSPTLLQTKWSSCTTSLLVTHW